MKIAEEKLCNKNDKALININQQIHMQEQYCVNRQKDNFNNHGFYCYWT